MADTSGINLREPDQMDWDNFSTGGSKYQAPPDALDASGKPIVYTAQLPKDLGAEARRKVTQEGFRSFNVGPVTILGENPYEVRFYDVSVKKFVNSKTGEPMEVSAAGKLIRGAGVVAKPQTNADYEKAVAAAAGRKIQVTLDWRAKNRDTGEEVKGFGLFPIDPSTGRRKAILKAGDTLTDGTIVTSEVLFANAVVRNVITK